MTQPTHTHKTQGGRYLQTGEQMGGGALAGQLLIFYHDLNKDIASITTEADWRENWRSIAPMIAPSAWAPVTITLKAIKTAPVVTATASGKCVTTAIRRRILGSWQRWPPALSSASKKNSMSCARLPAALRCKRLSSSSATDSQQRMMAVETGTCSDGAPCGSHPIEHFGDDGFCAQCPNMPGEPTIQQMIDRCNYTLAFWPTDAEEANQVMPVDHPWRWQRQSNGRIALMNYRCLSCVTRDDWCAGEDGHLEEDESEWALLDKRLNGHKYDADKPRLDLLIADMPRALEEVAAVLTYGASKYSPGNWQHVDSAERRYLAAGMRHELEYAKGEAHDDETNLHHLAHATCCLLFRLELAMRDE